MEKLTVADLDLVMHQSLTLLAQTAHELATDNVSKIIETSSEYLSEDVYEGLVAFTKLYEEATAETEQELNEMNETVGELVDALLDGDDAEKAGALNKFDQSQDRLRSVAQAQKNLESMVAMHDEIRDQLVPLLTTLQFHDNARQRMENLEYAWKLTAQQFRKDVPDWVSVSEAIVDSLKSTEEAATFYRLVLREDPPDAPITKGLVFEF